MTGNIPIKPTYTYRYGITYALMFFTTGNNLVYYVLRITYYGTERIYPCFTTGNIPSILRFIFIFTCFMTGNIPVYIFVLGSAPKLLYNYTYGKP